MHIQNLIVLCYNIWQSWVEEERDKNHKSFKEVLGYLVNFVNTKKRKIDKERKGSLRATKVLEKKKKR